MLSAPPADSTSQITVSQPDWGENKVANFSKEAAQDKIKTTWLGHACFLVELPSRTVASERGVRILFDPVFSDRCSPSQYFGPKRFTQPPCKIEEIPEVDAVVISHNHYDHLDTHTIETLLKRTTRTPHFFAPLGNAEYFKCLGVPESNTHIMDWWGSKRLEIENTSSDPTNQHASKRTVDITCTPCQHFTGRSLWDQFKTLWAGWAIEEVYTPATNQERPPVKVFFGGDTAYRTVLDGQDEDKVPVCPAFKEIGKAFGGFDFAMIPIGAYLPRDFMSRIHCAPQDSVRLFQDIRAKKALGMHWGTWILTTEDILEPPKRLAEECKKIGIEEDAFVTCDIGQTLLF
ncbi:beta-lactamase superfamily domain-containing protein [Crepidotus variabilis]|uniref:Beta-lactamase superfamily domain-containing protein n=1 Tax=Crepidotus variabilis TaxID=179855 RepID=A0A9P6E5I1_9AGAR|nr:beta-lactamase superfamily domain-containing protein [Crepidotus variabilis]